MGGADADLRQVHGKPDEEAEVHEPPGKAVERQHGSDRRGTGRRKTLANPGAGPTGSGHARPGGTLGHGDPEAAENRARLVVPSVREQESRRLGDVAVEQDQREPCGHPEEPHDPPAEVRDQPVGSSSSPNRKPSAVPIPATSTTASSAPLRRDRLGEQRVGDRQKPAGAHPHEEARHEVPVERRHRAAHRRPDEQRRREQDRGPAADAVAEAAPDAASRAPCRRSRRTGRAPRASGRAPDARQSAGRTRRRPREG